MFAAKRVHAARALMVVAEAEDAVGPILEAEACRQDTMYIKVTVTP
jgi:hypothetical protein